MSALLGIAVGIGLILISSLGFKLAVLFQLKRIHQRLENIESKASITRHATNNIYNILNSNGIEEIVGIYKKK